MRSISIGLILVVMCISVVAIDTSPYFPLEIEYEWVYQDSSGEGYDTVTTVITGTTILHGYDSYLFVTADVDTPDTQYYQVREDGLYNMFNMYIEMADISIENYPVLFLKNPVDVGDVWPALTIDTSLIVMGFPVTVQIDVDAEIEAYVDVDVPGGSFRDCLKIVSIATWKIDAGVMFSDSGVDIYSENYFAENVGLVKRIEYDIVGVIMGGSSDVTSSELLSYDFTNIDEQVELPVINKILTHPNPFNSEVQIQLNGSGFESLSIYDLNGRLIEMIPISEGVKSIRWTPAQGIESGIYFVKAFTPSKELTTRIIYLK
ncbi:T9SS type A sorting domain-containing protein [bacterium]|nr:T9SS type A sorting domain-containing protein [bacterium]